MNIMKRAHEIAKSITGGSYRSRLSSGLKQAWQEKKGENNKMKNLEAGKNYGEIFGLNDKSGKKMIYNGGISWTAIDGEKQMTMDSQKTTDNALEYISRPSCGTGIKF